MTKQDKQTMRIKEKIKDEFDKVNERGRFDEDFEEKILDLVDVLISTTRREAVEGFAEYLADIEAQQYLKGIEDYVLPTTDDEIAGVVDMIGKEYWRKAGNYLEFNNLRKPQ